MSKYQELEARVAAMKRRIESAPENTPDEVMWGWVEEFDQLIIDLGGEFEDEEYSIVKA